MIEVFNIILLSFFFNSLNIFINNLGVTFPKFSFKFILDKFDSLFSQVMGEYVCTISNLELFSVDNFDGVIEVTKWGLLQAFFILI